MSNFLEVRRDWQIDQVRADEDKGRISNAEALEQVVLINENYARACKWRDQTR